MNTIKNDVGLIVDDLGAINARIKELEIAAAALKKELIARGVGAYAGLEYVAAVKHYSKAVISPKLVRELAAPDFVDLVTTIQNIDSVTIESLNLIKGI
jgi:hypothetical protein